MTRKKKKTKKIKRFLLFLLILILLIAVIDLSGKLVYMANYQKIQTQHINKQQLQLNSLQEEVRANIAAQDQRITQLEARPTYVKPVEEKKAPAPEPQPKPEEKGTSFEAPSISPLVPLVGVLSLLGSIKNTLNPVGGH